MAINNRRTSNGRLLARFVYFGLTTTIAVVMFIIALVVWLTDLTGSVIASTLIVGGFSAVLSFVIYQLAIRDAVDQIREQVETVYEVTRLVKTGYEWVADKIALFMSMRGSQEK